MGAMHEQYRPTTWAEVAGQESAVRAIRTVLERGCGRARRRAAARVQYAGRPARSRRGDVKSQASEGWAVIPDRCDAGGFTGANLDRPALKRLLADIEAGRVDAVVLYKVDRGRGADAGRVGR